MGHSVKFHKNEIIIYEYYVLFCIGDNVIDRIGIEREFFLLKNGVIVEPALYGFPHDEFGFLVELRTRPHTNAKDLLKEYEELHSALLVYAEKLRLDLVAVHKMLLDKTFVDYLSKKYSYNSLLDTTANIYPNTSKSHATGIDEGYGTAGLHIHFSRHNEGGKRVQLPFVEIIKAFDERFKNIITLAGRNLGEFEIKQHGFEYRSLPADITLSIPIEFAFKILSIS
jgi:hypothetical protein